MTQRMPYATRCFIRSTNNPLICIIEAHELTSADSPSITASRRSPKNRCGVNSRCTASYRQPRWLPHAAHVAMVHVYPGNHVS